MLAIRMQRTGRKGHASFRVVVQDSRQTPSSGKFVAHLGSYDPHTKTAVLVKDKTEFYLEHGAHPSERVARLLKSEGIKLPDWVIKSTKKEAAIKNPEKLRRNQPAKPVEEVAEPASETPEAEAPEIIEEAPAAEAEVKTEAAEAPAAPSKVAEAAVDSSEEVPAETTEKA